MRLSVRAAFNSFTDVLEGHLSWMYLDVLGLVTTGRGNLIDPMPAALGLPWLKRDGSNASQAEIAAEWKLVKSLQSMTTRGGAAFASVTNLRLSEPAIDALCSARLEANAAALLRRFPAFESWPADAQLGALSMAWAMGSGFQFPKFQAAALAGDFATCAAECLISNGTAARNNANQTLFANAAAVVAGGLSYETLFFPKAL